MYYDGTYVLVLIGAIITLIASGYVKSTFNKYNRVTSSRRITGAEVARLILEHNNIYDVNVVPIAGNLTDNYNPASKTLSLSDSVYNRSSVAAIAVAAHECGHALQHAEGYSFLTFRSSLFPVVNIANKLAMPIILIGILIGEASRIPYLNGYNLITLGIWLFGTVVLFQLVTLPVEFNASNRALVFLAEENILEMDEHKKATKVLRAAAFTYVAAAASTVLQLLRLILIRDNRKR